MSAAREPLILLVHRIPYPPNKGDKIRSWHLLRYLAARYTVHLGAFADDPADLAHAATLRELCADVHLEPLAPLTARLRMVGALLRGEPLSIACYHAAAMRRWVRATVARTGATRFVAFSAAMAQYADELAPDAHRVLDMVDVDSDKWRQYAARHGAPKAWVYRREARRLLDWERHAAAMHAAVLFVSGAEADLFRGLAPEVADRVHAVGNGVDCTYFDPQASYPDPFAAGVLPLVFTGAMDYWPNVDAVGWFARGVLPEIRAAHPEAVLHIVGARPAPAVRQLERLPGVRVVGGVADMRPWLSHASLVVAPLRVARGIQNKVLEGFAMARPVLATPMALEGLELDDVYPLSAETAEGLAELGIAALADGAARELGQRMRAWMVARYDWQQRLAPIEHVLDPGRDAATTPVPGLRLAVS